MEVDASNLPDESNTEVLERLRHALVELGFADISVKQFRTGSVSGYSKQAS